MKPSEIIKKRAEEINLQLANQYKKKEQVEEAKPLGWANTGYSVVYTPEAFEQAILEYLDEKAAECPRCKTDPNCDIKLDL